MAPRGAHREVERSFAADSDAALPDLVVGAVAKVGAPAVHNLIAIYHDTPELRLAATQMTLRRRVGGSDDGWHLKLPERRGARVELHRAAGRSTRPPASVRRLIHGVTRGSTVHPVVELRTRREEYPLLDSEATVLGVVCDDRVSSRLLLATGDPLVEWREVEVELVNGDVDLLDLVGATLQSAGFPVAPQQSKLRRALGDRLPVAAQRHPLIDYLAAQRVALLTHDVLARAGADSGVHQLRVAARRLRCALLSYRRLLADRDAARHVANELRWFGRELAGDRDLQVVSDRLTQLLDHEAREFRAAPARRVVGPDMTAGRRGARVQSRATLDATRYLAMLELLERLTREPTLEEQAARKPTKGLRRGVRRSFLRLERRVAHDAPDSRSGVPDQERLHDIRKAAKRLRYSCEVAEPTLGKPARRLRRRAKQLSSALGEHQDTVVLRKRLEAYAQDPETPGRALFVLGRVHARQQVTADKAARRGRRAWARLSTKKSVGWLS